MGDSSRYDQRGVSASKSEVHEAIKGMDKGIFPNAFCKVLPDLAAGSPDYCNIMHADTAGTKTSLAYIYWKETGDIGVWSGVVQDAIVMNIDDMACTGCVDNIILSSTVGRNKSLIPGEVITEVIRASSRFMEKLKALGIHLNLAGGETADVGDIVRTIDVGITAFGRLQRIKVIDNNIQAGDVIIGLASYGQATYEDAYNGGMGSNGLTSARHDILSKEYQQKYPESFDPSIDPELIYCGSRLLNEMIEIDEVGPVPLGKLILSPTRTYLPVLKAIYNKHRKHINGVIHCTGGAQTKVMKFVKNKRIIKDNLLPIPPLFQIIEEESGTNRKELYEVFNMGHRMEIYCAAAYAPAIMSIIEDFNIRSKIIGRVEDANHSELIIRDDRGEYRY